MDKIKAIKVSVVIINKNEIEIEETLKALLPQINSNSELIVIDASNFKLDYIKNKYPQVKWYDYVVPLGKKFTIPNQRNFGVRQSNGSVVAFIDAGAIPSSNWLKNLTEPILKGLYEVTSGPVESSRDSVYKKINDFDDGAVVKSVLTTNVAFSRDAFERVNGFDERYEYGSDADFAWRLIGIGLPPVSVRSATIFMDWGDSKSQRNRAWRYGKAKARLFSIHPTERFNIINNSPEIAIYSLLLFTIFFGIIFLNPKLIVFALISYLALYVKNMRKKKGFKILKDHTILALSFALELGKILLISNKIKGEIVLHLPKDKDPYQNNLINMLNSHNIESNYLPDVTKSKMLNIFILPFTLFLERVSGSKIIHIHWLFFYQLEISRFPFIKKLLRYHFYSLLWFLKIIGFKLVWTAHNVLPHNKIFDNDKLARKKLLQKVDLVIAHNEYTVTKLNEITKVGKVMVIPQGAYVKREDAENNLIGKRREKYDKFYILGNIDEYKGVTEFLESITADVNFKKPLFLEIKGLCKNNNIKEKIEFLIKNNQSKNLTISFENIYLNDEMYRSILSSWGVIVMPFLKITNSGSLVNALSNGSNVITFNLPQFQQYQGSNLLKMNLTEENINQSEPKKSDFINLICAIE